MQNPAVEWAKGRPGRIIAPDGEIIFEGDIAVFRDCFFNNADWAVVTDWAAENGFTAELVPEPEAAPSLANQ